MNAVTSDDCTYQGGHRWVFYEQYIGASCSDVELTLSEDDTLLVRVGETKSDQPLHGTIQSVECEYCGEEYPYPNGGWIIDT
jgi:hypothetical protein